MSEPRQILPGSTYLVTRRCSERRCFLRPDAFVAWIFSYCLALAARLKGIQIHAYVVLSDHWHAVVTDPGTKISEFLRQVHRLVACAVNVYRGRWEAMWSSAKPSVVRLETPDDILDKMVYVIANAVTSGLVPSASEWPGLVSDPKQILSQGVEVRRPDRYFDPKGKMPETVTLKVTRPPGFDHLSDEAFVELLCTRVSEREALVRDEMEAAGRGFLGADAVMAQDWRESPKTPAPRRTLNPHIAARDPEVRIAALARLSAFRQDYRRARQRWCRGLRRTVFPAGTYWMRVAFGVSCRPPPGAA